MPTRSLSSPVHMRALPALASAMMISAVLYKSSADPEPGPPPDVNAILEDVEDQRELIDRWRLLHRLASTEYPNRVSDLNLVLTQGEETLSTQAASALLWLQAGDSVDAMTEAALRWSEVSRNGLMSRIYYAPTGPIMFGEVARRILERIVADPLFALPDPDPRAGMSSANYAALALAQAPAPGDGALIQRTLPHRAGSWGVWLARGTMRSALPLTQEEVALGNGIIADPAADERVRIAASVALFGASNEATRRVTEGIDAGLAEFGALDSEALAQSAILERSPEARAQSKRLAAFLALVSDLEHLPDQAYAREAIERCRATENRAIFETAAYVAARRFPEILITSGRGQLKEKQFDRLLSLIARTHPDMRPMITMLYPHAVQEAPQPSPDDFDWTGGFGGSTASFIL